MATRRAPADAGTLLRSAGLRSTAPRRTVLTWLERHPHATADAVLAGVRADLAISHQAVYDVLRACVGAGLVRSIQPAGHPARFERRVGDNHHHVICRNCGRIEDTDCASGEPPCLTPADNRSFAVDEAEIVSWGRCQDCGRGEPEERKQ